MSRLARDGTAEPVLRDQVLRRERRQGKKYYITRLILIIYIYIIYPFAICDVQSFYLPCNYRPDFDTFDVSSGAKFFFRVRPCGTTNRLSYYLGISAMAKKQDIQHQHHRLSSSYQVVIVIVCVTYDTCGAIISPQPSSRYSVAGVGLGKAKAYFKTAGI